MKILANDGIHSAAQAKLEELGHQVFTEHVEQKDLAVWINENNIEAIFVRSATKVREDLIKNCPNLKYIGRAGVGLDNIDVDYAKEQGRHVFNTPRASSRSVAELVMTYIYDWSRRVGPANYLMGNAGFKDVKKGISRISYEVQGKTLGIIGFGNIGQTVARLAEANGMDILVYDPNQDCKWSTSMEALLIESDFVTIHIGGKAQVLGKEDFEMMKSSAVVINTSRGGCVNEEELLEALKERQFAGACLDVFMNEPEPDRRLLNNSRVIATPHIGGSTNEAQVKIGLELVSQLEELA